MKRHLPKTVGEEGRPYAPALRILEDAYPELNREGQVLTHLELARLLDLSLSDPACLSRYRGIMDSWKRKLLRERGIFLCGRKAKGEGYRVLKADEMVEHSVEQYDSMRRTVRKSIRVAASAPDSELDDAGRRKRDFVVQQSANVLLSIEGTQKVIQAGIASPSTLPPALDLGVR